MNQFQFKSTVFIVLAPYRQYTDFSVELTFGFKIEVSYYDFIVVEMAGKYKL